MEQEVWKDIKGHEGLYQVSNLGRVKSLERMVKRNGKGDLPIPEKILKIMIDKKGYSKVSLQKHGLKIGKIHRLVAQAFIPNPNNYPQINHKNCIKTDNQVENLEWCDNAMNHKHAMENGLYKNMNGKKIILLDKNDKIIMKFNSQKETAKFLNINTPYMIRKAIIGKYYLYGYKIKDA